MNEDFQADWRTQQKLANMLSAHDALEEASEWYKDALASFEEHAQEKHLPQRFVTFHNGKTVLVNLIPAGGVTINPIPQL